MRLFLFSSIIILAISCGTKDNGEPVHHTSGQQIFRDIGPETTGIRYSNDLVHTERLNTYTYRNFYNGAGVAAGDVNNDGLTDLYFAGNQVDNKLYLNRGNFTFEDVTEKAGLACSNVWSTGVSMADVNGDGWLDIYVCKSGPPDRANRNNELFINNGDLTFTEKSAEYGIDDRGLSNHAAFFDYDKDGDLDMYLLNNSLRSIGIYDLREGQREVRDPDGGNKLYRNDGDTFTDVSASAGIYGSAIGFGLGVTVADINKDQWPDIFVSNDFFERDYLYLNNQDGTFREVLTETMNEISMGSMGADIADMNNDTYPDIYVSEMLPATLERVKTKTLFEDWDKYQSNVTSGYHHQFTRNAFQLNNGPVPGDSSMVSFSEVSRMTGTDATDWSWGALLFDVNNDGYRDIFVANGIFKDLTDQDYVNFYSNNEILISRHKQDSTLLTTLIDKIPSVPLRNFLFLNRGNLEFEEAAEAAGLDFKGFSNGAVYADLDNDGDLDLVLNNINDRVRIYENLTDGNYLQLSLTGYARNSHGIGSQVYAYAGEAVFSADHFPVKGYMSSMDPRIHLGLGKHEVLDSLIIRWPDGKVSSLYNVSANQSLIIEHATADEESSLQHDNNGKWLVKYDRTSNIDTVTHVENDHNDFNRDRLLYEMYSNEGPGAAAGDVSGDGLDDFVIGGSRGEPMRVFVQESTGDFRILASEVFLRDAGTEDVETVLFDADGDGDLDIFAASGSSEYAYLDFMLKDRLYFNNGDGTFKPSDEFKGLNIPSEPTGFAKCYDLDGDGDLDIITGTRSIPFKYGMPGGMHIYQNLGEGEFELIPVSPELRELGLLTDLAIGDINGDGSDEFVVVGEWMSPICLSWNGNTMVRNNILDDLPSGLYKTVQAVDLGNDERKDLIFGNYGLNSRLSASPKYPLTWNISDYDQNGQVDHILSIYEGDTLYPLILLQDLSKQLPLMRKRFQTFSDYGTATTAEVLDGLNRSGERKLMCEVLESYVWISGDSIVTLPLQAQLSPIFAIQAIEMNNNGALRLLLGGNQKRVKPELGSQNASFGTVLEWKNGKFDAISNTKSGFWVRGEVRQIINMRIGDERNLIVVRNNDDVEVFKLNR